MKYRKAKFSTNLINKINVFDSPIKIFCVKGYEYIGNIPIGLIALLSLLKEDHPGTMRHRKYLKMCFHYSQVILSPDIP
jgi:hypothetical protein